MEALQSMDVLHHNIQVCFPLIAFCYHCGCPRAQQGEELSMEVLQACCTTTSRSAAGVCFVRFVA